MNRNRLRVNARKIRDEIIKLKMMPEEFAKNVGLSLVTIRNLFYGRHTLWVEYETLTKLAKYLGLKVTDLIMQEEFVPFGLIIDSKKLGTKLKEKNVSVYEFSKSVRVSMQTVYLILADEGREICPRCLYRIAAGLECEPLELLKDELPYSVLDLVRFKQLLQERGLSVAKLSRESGVRRNLISNIMLYNFTYRASPKVITAFAQALGVNEVEIVCSGRRRINTDIMCRIDGRKLLVKILNKGISKKELSKMTGIHLATIGRFVNGYYVNRWTRRDMVRRLATALQCEESELLMDNDTIVDDVVNPRRSVFNSMKINPYKLYKFMAEKYWSVYELARQAGLNLATVYSAISTFERRKRFNSMTVYKLAQALGVDPTEILSNAQ